MSLAPHKMELRRPGIDQPSQRTQLALETSAYRGLKCVTCEALGDTLVLRGRVGSYFLKQLAQTIASRFVPPGFIQNCVEVDSPSPR